MTTESAAATPGPDFDLDAEFERQVQRLLDKGYPRITGLQPPAFRDLVRPLHQVVLERKAQCDPPTKSRVPFVVVVTKELAPVAAAMARTDLQGKPGFVTDGFEDVAGFPPIESVEIPSGSAYVLFDVDRGAEYLNVRPDAALTSITAAGRTPLTVDEGIAFITAFPDSLEKNNCFSLLASRGGDQRVPALWISKAMPKLGWCWAGNPHTWLGSASAGGRAGAPA
ncbi:MAG: DUF5701 family protein [Actinomycetota bacterium]|nr:DUF5701 family protein [Actinomycetota bacterium]